MATISEVASKAGVSKTTVSRILNRQGSFSEETIANVMQAVKELNYQPNEVARTLGKNKSKTIALIFPTQDIPSFVEIQSALEGAFYQRGYKAILFSSLFNKEKEKDTVQMLQNNMIDGIVLGSYTKEISHFTDCSLPIVAAGRKFDPKIPSVKADDYGAGILAGRHLLNKQCKKLLYLTNNPDGIEHDERFEGFKSVIDKSDSELWSYEISLDAQLNYDFSSTIHRMIVEHPDADGIFAETDVLAMSCIQNYSSLGYRIPEDIKIIGYGNMFFSALSNPPLTTIKEDRKQTADTIATVLINLIENQPIENTEIEVPVSLIARQST